MPNERLHHKAGKVAEKIVKAVIRKKQLLTQVKAPPGAGKTTLTRRLIVEALARNVSALVAVQTNAQAVDLMAGLARQLEKRPELGKVGYWPSKKAQQEWAKEIRAFLEGKRIVLCKTARDVTRGPRVVVAVARKWSWHAVSPKDRGGLDRKFDVGVVDEAYQMRTGELVRFGRHVRRLCLIGDPGQLDPFTTVDETRWHGLEVSPITPAPRAVSRLRPGEVVTFNLPASLRLDYRAAPLVQACFYPELQFKAVARKGDRQLKLAHPTGRRGGTVRAVDKVLDHAAVAGWGTVLLPSQVTIRDDPELADAVALVVRRLLGRAQRYRAEYPKSAQRGQPLSPSDVAVVVAHRDQKARVRERLDESEATKAVTVDTANRLQGRQFEVIVAWHPLSGRVDASEFHLDTGRLCVMASRHRQACIFVCRDGVGELLDEHLPSGLRPVETTEDREYDGWVAHTRMWAHLAGDAVRLG